MSPLASQARDFPQWYQDVIAQAALADKGPVKGTIVIRPYGYGIWELMQEDLDRRIKLAGARNCYMPLFIPAGLFEKEGDHFDGFEPEVATVTHGGGEELAEPLIVRPTSELLFGQSMAKWIQSYRDLPMLLNQWANVVRWELRPRLFVRTTEFLWQEGHTAHETQQDAAAYARHILHHVYEAFMLDVMKLPVLVGRKSPNERFPGALNSMTCEGLMRDGKALQMGTSHEFGQNFSRMSDITFSGRDGQRQYCWTSSWGVSTRLIGALIMAHGDDKGLNLPPALAPTQVAVVGVREGPGVEDYCRKIASELDRKGIRVSLDVRWEQRFGRRVTDWELKGVPVRLEIGPQETLDDSVSLVQRLAGTHERLSAQGAISRMDEYLTEAGEALLARARKNLTDITQDADTLSDAIAAGTKGVARIPWSVISSAEALESLKLSKLSVRCLQSPDGGIPLHDHSPGSVAFVARSY